MSVLIRKGGGDQAGANNSTTNPDSSEGPDHFWAGLRLACPTVHLERTVGLSDGTATLFNLGDNYEAGYLDIFLNGIKQRITTHYTETSADNGTFTFVTAPPAGYFITAIYAKLCDEDLTFGSSTGLPARKPSAFPGLGPYQRVYAAGGGGANGAKFVYTDNIYAASPTWVAVNTGLPSSSGSRCYAAAGVDGRGLAIDPFNPSSAGLVAVFNNTTSSGEVYKNTAIRTSGSWSSVFTVTTWNTLTGNSDAAIDIYELQATIAASGIYYMAVAGDVSGEYRIIHTHDSGSNWTASAAFSSFISSIWVGQRNALLCYVLAESSGDSQGHVYHNLADHHVWADTYDSGLTLFGANTIVGPLGTDDSEVIIALNDGVNDILRRSTNSASTFSSLNATAPFDDKEYVYSNTELNNVFVITNGASATALRRSVDRGATFSTVTLPAADGGWKDIALLGADTLTIVRSALGTAVSYIYTSPDHSVFTSRQGNLGSLFDANQGIYNVAYDWTS